MLVDPPTSLPNIKIIPGFSKSTSEAKLSSFCHFPWTQHMKSNKNVSPSIFKFIKFFKTNKKICRNGWAKIIFVFDVLERANCKNIIYNLKIHSWFFVISIFESRKLGSSYDFSHTRKPIHRLQKRDTLICQKYSGVGEWHSVYRWFASFLLRARGRKWKYPHTYTQTYQQIVWMYAMCVC